MKQIVLLTDFGNDFFVSIIKSLLYSRGVIPVIDLKHDLDSFSIKEAAFILYLTYRYFPKNSIFLTIVDPTVGISTNRLPLLAKIKGNYFYIGPDNGILTYFINNKLIEKVFKISKYKSLSTFDARDIYTPFALSLYYNEINFDNLEAINIDKLKTFDILYNKDKNYIEGYVAYIDKYGNCISNIKKDDIDFEIDFIKIKDYKFNKISSSYFQLEKGGVLFNSWQYLEFAKFKDDFSKVFNILKFEKIYIYGKNR